VIGVNKKLTSFMNLENGWYVGIVIGKVLIGKKLNPSNQ